LYEIHAEELLVGILESRELHYPWVELPTTVEAVRHMLTASPESNVRYGIRAQSGELGGVVNLNGIMRGAFHNAFLGYYALHPHAGRGLMRSGLDAVIQAAFSVHSLHRLEANVQPANLRSARLVKSLGFRLEGHSPRYLRIGGAWRDHDRYALTAEDRLAQPSDAD
jgi:ribosomal-protein-alanine N-acetyltransferase